MKHRGEETKVLSADERNFDIGSLSHGSIQVSCGLYTGETTTQNENPRFLRAKLRCAYTFNIAPILVVFLHLQSQSRSPATSALIPLWNVGSTTNRALRR